MSRHRRWATALLLALAICVAPAGAVTVGSEVTIGTARPALVVLPDDHADPHPLLLVLHGYSGSGAGIDRYLAIRDEAVARGIVLAFPDGTQEPDDGPRFWNASDACCNLRGSAVDDSEYLAGLVEDIADVVAIDRRRIYVMGHSNGAFMAYRLACDRPEQFAAIATLAGAMPANPRDCGATKRVSVLHLHGTDDAVVPIAGGKLLATFPSTALSLRPWARLARCNVARGLVKVGTLDIERSVQGAETTRLSYACPKGVDVELWRIAGGRHTPSFTEQFGGLVLDWLLRWHR